MAFVIQNLLQRVEHFRTITQGFAEALRANGDDHKFLHVDTVVRVRTAIDDVHHRHR